MADLGLVGIYEYGSVLWFEVLFYFIYVCGVYVCLCYSVFVSGLGNWSEKGQFWLGLVAKLLI